MRTVLFLCSGNYYRSRFAEELFNHMAAAKSLPWEADSAGLNLNPNNKGPMSGLVLEQLEKLSISPLHENRFPRPAESFELACASIIVALSHKEHYGLMRKVFPRFVSNTLYWNVGDTDDMKSSEALAAIENQVATLVGELENESTNVAGTG
ncbi:MAG: low molecular weight phosphatase family protein [Chloroflexi bacterium]|nr:low molecular weight phosphatase family protein [Chloroflexota bacterium]